MPRASQLRAPPSHLHRRHVLRLKWAGNYCVVDCGWGLPHFPSSHFAIDSVCTSSGPSASRSVRTLAQALARNVSSETPAPPCAWIARSSTRSVTFGATTLIIDRKSTRLNSSHLGISYAVFCLKKKKKKIKQYTQYDTQTER